MDKKRPHISPSGHYPTPVRVTDSTIRIYAGFLDGKGISRIGFIDVDAQNPSVIRHISNTPVLDVGKPGTFDDNGVILGDVLSWGKTVRMYYVGFQLVEKVKFLAFSGLAVSHDHGQSFTRVSDTPVFDRAPHEYYCRAIHSVIRESNRWRIWYAAGNSWEIIGGKPYPRYSIHYTESRDGRTFLPIHALCIKAKGNQYRIGRPRVYKTPAGYEMFYTIGTRDKRFFPGYAVSKDGVSWQRRDADVGIGLSPTGWDSKMVCYPAVIRSRYGSYMFYNGNNFGESGLGYAILATNG